jgi:hypothetical protein
MAIRIQFFRTFAISPSHLPAMDHQRELRQPAQRKASNQQEGPLQTPPSFQLKAANFAPTPAAQLKASPGGMPSDLVNGFAASTGHDLSGVQVHKNSTAPAQVGALAYAQGNEIHLGPGQDQHLAHEAAHVVQQREGRVQANTEVGGKPVNDQRSLETEADSMGAKAAQMKAAPAMEGLKTQSGSNDVSQQKAAPVQRLMNPSYPWDGVIDGTPLASLRSSAGITATNTLADLPKGTKVKVTSATGNWLNVDVTVGGKAMSGFVSQELVNSPEAASLNNTVAAVDTDMNRMWKDSFNKDKSVVEEQGMAIVDKAGTTSAKNQVKGGSGSVVIDHSVAAGETLKGDIHTHPYSTGEGGMTGVPFSGGDISSLRGLVTQGFQRLVEAGTARFALVITDAKKATAWFAGITDAKIQSDWDAAFAAGTGTFQENCAAAVYAVVGKSGANGISFYGTTDKKKSKFVQM